MQKFKVYAGLDINGKPIKSALGSYCAYKKRSGISDNKIYNNFEEFSKDLEKECIHDPPSKGELKFTPTLDLVGKQLYYQVKKKKKKKHHNY